MRKAVALLLCLLCLAIPATAAQPDKPGCVDHPLFPTRMPEYRLKECFTREFDMFQGAEASRGGEVHVPRLSD